MLEQRIEYLNPCGEAIKWLASYSDPQQAWDECERGDWMLWLLGKLSGPVGSDSRKKLVLCACQCARLAPPIKNPQWEQARLDCLNESERYAKGEEGATLDTLKQKRDDAAYGATVATVAIAAANATVATVAAVSVANVAAYTAAHTAATAADAGIYKKTLALAADIVRQHYVDYPTV